MLGVLAVAVLVMGVYPKPFTDVMQVSVAELLRHVAIEQDSGARSHELGSRHAPEIALLVFTCGVALVDLWRPWARTGSSPTA